MKEINENPGKLGNPVDDYFKKALHEYQVFPPEKMWTQISRTLLIRELVRFNFTNIPRIISISALVSISVITAFFLFNNSEDQAPENQITTKEPSLELISQASTIVTTKLPVSEVEKASEEINSVVAEPEHNIHKTKSISIVSNPLLNTSVNSDLISTSTNKSQGISKKLKSEYFSIYKILPLNKFSLLNYNLKIPQLSSFHEGLISKPVSPSFFSASFEVSPEITYHKTDDLKSKEISYWTKLGLTYHISRFTLSTGASLGYSTTDAKYKIKYRSNDSIGFFTSIVSFYVNPLNPDEILFDTKTTTVYDSIDHLLDDRARSRYTYVRIPLLIGYDLLQTNKLTVNFHAGPAITFLVSEKQAQPFIDYPNSRIIRIESVEPARIKTGLQIWSGLHIDYQLTKGFSFYAEPTLKYYVKTKYSGEEILSEEPWSIGLGIGIQYNFGRK